MSYKSVVSFTCNYGYSMDSEAVPDWFRAAWAAHTGQDRRTKGS